jgi:hypothetical protein
MVYFKRMYGFRFVKLDQYWCLFQHWSPFLNIKFALVKVLCLEGAFLKSIQCTYSTKKLVFIDKFDGSSMKLRKLNIYHTILLHIPKKTSTHRKMLGTVLALFWHTRFSGGQRRTFQLETLWIVSRSHCKVPSLIISHNFFFLKSPVLP